MEKFSKEFYASRIQDWITKYVKLKELCKLIKSIKKDIEKNGGQINEINHRNPSINFDDSQRNTISAPLDRHSVGLDVLEDTEGLFNKNEKIFETPLMYEINELFGTLNDLEYCDDIKIFLYFLTIEVHNVYVFYLSIEKNIFTRVNEHSNKRKKYDSMTDDELLEELTDLTDITYLMYTFYSYIDLNVKAIKEILKYFDDHFQIINHNISMEDLYFKRYLTKKDSDLRYILSFKIIIESCALIESYCQDISALSNTKEIKEQKRELKEVLTYLNEKDTDRVNDEIHEVYLKQKKNHFNNIVKQKKNLKLDIQNSFCVDVHQQEDFYKSLGEKQFDEEINIKITRSNLYNLVFLFFHTFVYSFFYIMPYLVFYFYFVNGSGEIHIYYLGFILTSTHLGNFISKIIINSIEERFKIKVIIFCICFILSFVLSIYSEKLFKETKDEKIFFVLNIISRFIYGFSCGRLLTRQYIMQYLPESDIKFFSLTYLLIIYLGGLFGIIINFLLKEMKPLYFDMFSLYIENYYIIFGIGAIISFFYLILIIIFFTEPNKGTMLNQYREKPSQKEEIFDQDIYKEKKHIADYKELFDENETGDETNKLSNLLFRESSLGIKRKTSNNDLIITSNIDLDIKEDFNKTFDEKIPKKMTENILDSNYTKPLIELTGKEDKEEEEEEKGGDESLTTPLNKTNIKSRESKNTDNLDSNHFNSNTKASKDVTGNEILSDEEMKGLNSIEKGIKDLNDQFNFDDVNQMPNELERIRKSNYKNNRNYISSFLVFISTLLLTTSFNEFTLLSAPLFFLSKITRNNKDILVLTEESVIIVIIVLQILSFPFINFVRMMKAFKVERRLLLIFYSILSGLMITFLILKYFLFGWLDHNDDSIFFILGIIILFCVSNLIEGTTHLLSNKIIPFFVKFCKINNKYLISYSTGVGKILGGLIFCAICLTESENTEFAQTNIFKYNLLIFSSITIILFVFFLIFYKKLRVRAIAKIFYIND